MGWGEGLFVWDFSVCFWLVGWLFLDSLIFTGLYRNCHHTYVIRVKIQQK